MKKTIAIFIGLFSILDAAIAVPYGIFGVRTITKREILGEIKFEVLCETGAVEIVKAKNILDNTICGGGDLAVWHDEKMHTQWKLLAGSYSLRTYLFSETNLCRYAYGNMYRYASPIEVSEAVSRGLADPDRNPIFGYYLSRQTRVWTNQFVQAPTNTSLRNPYDIVTFNLRETTTQKTEQILLEDTASKGAVLCVH